MPTTTTGRENQPSEGDEIVSATTRILMRLQQNPSVGSSEWPGITMQQLRVLLILYIEGPTRVSTLAKRLGVSTPTITGILDRLVRQQLTRRADDPRDRRVVLNALTNKGQQIVERLHPLNAARLSEAVNRLTEEQQAAVASALSTLADAVEAANHG